ncbi:hypothetical protein FQ142_08285 [Microbacterium sp. ANT_H45B]|uniref:hypothetical protein n=1 Tax=Microbacterium sp. ANT_H45B TaxID=2597346 RepID=UPI0011EC2C4F|nr:hypothetical protein [Microbacterium sp. ANT_H45B]KAA0960869.1 hypothetical protein FQ142_08285 [Microbacterium sp. ANT_H45B]
MDQGWAVVLGAVIALTGSSLVPWVREAASAKGARDRDRADRVRAAVIDLLGANAAQAAALAADEDASFVAAVAERGRAAAALLIELPADDRAGLAPAIQAGSASGSADARYKLAALQHVLTAWTAGDLRSADAESACRAEIARLKSSRP